MKKWTLSFFSVLVTFIGFSQQQHPLIVADDSENQKKWVDSIYSQLSVEEKFGQLFMVDLFSSDPQAKIDKIKTLITDYHLGGIIFSKGGPVRQAKLTNEFQELAKIPILIGMDAEWGLAMRLDSTYAYPWNMTLGAITDNKIVEEVGKRIGEHSKRMGVHFNFAPVVDINVNPKNPIIGNRSFGEDKYNVTEKALAFMKGMQSVGVLGSAKHFPGHGDTDKDSHKTLPTIDFSKKRLDTLELYPYQPLIDNGIGSIMVAHLNVPAYQSDGVPSTLSKNIVTNLLKNEMGFEGLIITDALNMKGVSNFKNPGEVEMAAFMAGNDIFLIPEDMPKAMEYLIAAYDKNEITEERLEYSVKKVLNAKYKVGLNNYKPINTTFLTEELNTVNDDALHEKVMDHAVTVIKNKREIVPIKELENKKIAYVQMGDDSGDVFFNELNKYAKITKVSASSLNEYIEKLKAFNCVIIGFHKPNRNPWENYQFTETELVWLYEIARTNTVILNVFARPYALLDLKTTANFESIVLAYQNSEISQKVTAQLIFGAREAKGVLPVSLGEDFPVKTSLATERLYRLQYGSPESVGMNSYILNRIDSLVNEGLNEKMFPGAQVLVARKGKVIYQKNFGYHDYSNTNKVEDTTMYDLASLTKILATMPIMLDLSTRNKISLDSKLSELLPEYKGTNKAHITVKDMLSHYARLRPWIPFFRETLIDKKKGASPTYYSTVPTRNFNIQVAENLYMRSDYTDTIYKIIKESTLLPRLEYKYSDLPYYLLKPYFEKVYKMPMETIVQEKFYKPMGANYTTYLPLTKFDKNNIPPTEQDEIFRGQRVQGYVHDQGAAMLGGVSGHAGLFSNANDVAKLMQLFLWKGFYGGERYFNPEVFEAYNTCYYCSKKIRRGVGFDKPQLGNVGPTCGCVSMTSFGHGGFTGTFTWADPDFEIIYVFLTNRTFPDAENRKLIQSDTRSKIQEIIYEAIIY
ncbi:MAG: serine hydrolase [Bacteroidetes bacterium]|nr:serine hydrolase [Bacteroidota bacterium]